ncbi:MAG: LPS assembly protein LptD [Desulfobulbaceae bacterium]|nr:LPS assembly protein LptD [Desulfobulbaceae bacterium]
MRKRLNKKKVAGLLSVFACLWASQCGARDIMSDPWQITADKISRYRKPDNIVAEGNVVLRRVEDDRPDALTIKADWIRYNLEEGLVHARGNLSMRNTNEDVDAGEALIDLNNETATLSDTTLFVPENNLHFSGKKVEKNDAVTYRFEDGDFTTCKVEEGKKLPWQFHSAETIVKLEKTVVLKHTVLRVKGVPVFYMPYIVLPGNTKRKTGFLLPEFSQSSRSGSGLITPFFVDLSPSSDITFYPGYLAKRGVFAGAEFRYVADYNSRATIAATYIRDKTEDTGDDDYKSDDYLRTEKNRYWLRGKVDHDFGRNLLLKADVDLASDRDYLQEFGDYANGFEDSDEDFLEQFHRGLDEETLPYRTSQVQLGKSWASSYFGGQFVAIDDLVDDSSKQGQVNTLPRLLYNSIFELDSMPLTFSWNSEYVNYYRDEGVGEHRLNMHPRLTAPLPLGSFFEGTLSGGLQETFYSIDAEGGGDNDWDYDDSQIRTAFDFNANIATTVARDFDLNVGSVSWLNHFIRPEIDYTYVSVDHQDRLPGIDDVDQLELKNLLTYSVNNYFRVGGNDNGSYFNRYIGYLKLEQSYDIHEARSGSSGVDGDKEPFSDILLTLNVYPLPGWETRYETSYNVYGEGVRMYNLYSRYASERGDSLSLDYRYTKGSEVNQFNAEALTRLTDTLFLEGDIQQSLHTDETVSASVGLIYHPGCWAVKVQAEKNSDDERIVLMFSLVGFGETLGFGLSGDFEKGFDFDSGSDVLEFD